ncbi:hypothetical protein PAXRUDRAFT_826222 [Paxillus rubicundulus Ve08.2h10]|uniref:Unplaced genomic scaffold scaffold_177, whole genome shotgun sequence n=1 Tax=Paxillus rubicundulus Ve08.2h10 TaxID=930991 RepID=A0A0D0DZR7_9AGAM|nr:hypothetical protein PAXRUDRAFT_826222 [Paxillus rubicundulus Ve08.2h10]
MIFNLDATRRPGIINHDNRGSSLITAKYNCGVLGTLGGAIRGPKMRKRLVNV